MYKAGKKWNLPNYGDLHMVAKHSWTLHPLLKYCDPALSCSEFNEE